MDKCPECGSVNLACFSKQNEMFCNNCGLVIDDTPIDDNTFGSTTVRHSPAEPYMLRAGTNNNNGKIFKDSWFYSTKEKNINKGLSRINWIVSKLNLPEYATKEAKRIFKMAIERDLSVGRDNVTLAYASVYASCLIHSIPKTPYEVVAFTSVCKNKMMRHYRLLKKRLNINAKPIDPTDLIPRFGSRLYLKNKTITLAIEIAMKVNQNNLLNGKSPATIGATCLYIATRLNDDYRPQREITNVSGVLEVTVRKWSKIVAENISR
ncbi:transcription initiation factor IIB family protein [Candidatus Woesearchaeota archaeon]|nr:transcription initiation factor IIB family protein [Candidatus Woesearchaeota archaeon]